MNTLNSGSSPPVATVDIAVPLIAKIIMGRVAGFIRQCRRMSLDEKQTAKDLPEFEAIDRDINLFLYVFERCPSECAITDDEFE